MSGLRPEGVGWEMDEPNKKKDQSETGLIALFQFDGYGMQPGIEKFAQGIIHKAMGGHA